MPAPPKPIASGNAAPAPTPAAVAAPDPGLSVRDILDRMDRMDDRASAERRAQAEAFSARIEAEADHAQQAAQALVDALGQRVGDLGAAVDKRIGDLLAEQASARRENRWLMMLMVAGLLALGGINVALQPDGGIDLSRASVDAEPAPVAP
jgi:regulator of protease activity HflC (stomatin/prohibitin superfamily)